MKSYPIFNCLQTYISTKSFKLINFVTATSQAIVLMRIRKESPDSTEQCTGEEPGVHPELVEGCATDCATENNCLLSLLQERVWVRLKT